MRETERERIEIEEIEGGGKLACECGSARGGWGSGLGMGSNRIGGGAGAFGGFFSVFLEVGMAEWVVWLAAGWVGWGGIICCVGLCGVVWRGR